jgi:hypothetical protein
MNHTFFKNLVEENSHFQYLLKKSHIKNGHPILLILNLFSRYPIKKMQFNGKNGFEIS